jgi:phage virion morphogenesis protein
MEISIEIKDAGVKEMLARIARKGEDITGALQIIGERILRHTGERFTAQRDADGKPWKPLKPATLKHKKNPMILTESHQLRDSIRYQVSDNVLRVGTNKVYGAIHQLGGKAGRGRKVNIPARPYLGVGKEDAADIVQVLTDWLEVK